MTTPSESAPVTRLAAKVAHELNNPLDAVLRFVSLAQRKAQAGNIPDVHRHLEDAQFGLQRMAEILRELMDLGRQTHDILAPQSVLPLPQLLTHAIRTIAPLAEQRGITLSVDNGLSAQPRYDLRLSQILANLLKNALEAAPEKSTISLSITQNADQRTRNFVRIAITDEGPGIDPQILPQLFTPFTTTKSKGKGHGLGLSISRELALSMGGDLTLENLPTGCLAAVTLPFVHEN